MCPDNTCNNCCSSCFSGIFKNSNSFAMPACGASIDVVFDKVTEVAIGSYLWAAGIGMLEVVGFNSETCEIKLRNNCPEDSCTEQADPGEPILACTAFVLTIPTCSVSGAGSLYPFLNSSFAAPADGDCIDISVTNVNGLSVGKNVSIAGGTYRISEIKSGVLITICNDGEGLTPGTVVDYEDGSGNLIVPIILIDANPCLTPEVLSGIPLVCADEIVTPLHGSEDGQVLVWDETTGVANFRNLGIPVIDCTVLTACLTLDPDLPEGTEYLILVESAADFQLGDIILIQGTEFEITEIVDYEHIRAVPIHHPTAIQTYPEGSQVCLADCCTLLENNICSHGNWLGWGVEMTDADAIHTDVITSGETSPGYDATVILTNNSSIYKMRGLVTIDWGWEILLDGDSDGQIATVRFQNDLLVNGVGGEFQTMPRTYQVHTNALDFADSQVSSYTFYTDEIDPGASLPISSDAKLFYVDGTVPSIQVFMLATHITVMGFALIP